MAPLLPSKALTNSRLLRGVEELVQRKHKACSHIAIIVSVDFSTSGVWWMSWQAQVLVIIQSFMYNFNFSFKYYNLMSTLLWLTVLLTSPLCPHLVWWDQLSQLAATAKSHTSLWLGHPLLHNREQTSSATLLLTTLGVWSIKHANATSLPVSDSKL